MPVPGMMYGQGDYGMMGSMGPEGWILAALAIALPLLLLAIVWSLVWKALALWHAARRGQYVWFCILLVVNTLGILEMIYLFVVAQIKPRDLFSTRSGTVAPKASRASKAAQSAE